MTAVQREAYRNMFQDYPDVVDVEQFCKMLSISKKTGYRILQGNEIQYIKSGRSYRIPKVYVISYCLACGGAGTEMNNEALQADFV